MKLIVYSDSHGAADRMEDILLRHFDTADGFLFLGDGLREFRALEMAHPGRLYAAVRGNCDAGAACADVPTSLTLHLDGVRLFLCHGHTFGVKSGTERLEAVAAQTGADVVLHGHTHEAFQRFVRPDAPGAKPFYLFCPGSLSLPRAGAPSYGILESRPNGILLTVAAW